jgi:hypothetical protein
MKVTIDRFEGSDAVLELPSGDRAVCSRKLLPGSCREGDILDITATIDLEGRADREREVRDLQEKLKNKK